MYTLEEQLAHREQWVEALRSEKYQQGQDKLRDGNKFCCLGVACDISGLGEWVTTEHFDDDGMPLTGYEIPDVTDTECHVLPVKVMEWLGVDNSEVTILDNDVDLLTRANDEGYSFSKIADIIEAREIEILDTINCLN